MTCGDCGHKNRHHMMGRCFEGSGANGLTVCPCNGWSPASNKAVDYLCAACKTGRGFDWLGGRVVCWPCWRDREAAGVSEIVVKPGPLVRKAP